MCVEFWDEILLRGGECETPENPDFLRNEKIVISVKIRNFSSVKPGIITIAKYFFFFKNKMINPSLILEIRVNW